ncbi:hypothetical protein FRC09_007519 [Ceratobasidium sp. 395]|nr:hypothetical protein FRC09_007519 [Ceratobasidium sp. 395]
MDRSGPEAERSMLWQGINLITCAFKKRQDQSDIAMQKKQSQPHDQLASDSASASPAVYSFSLLHTPGQSAASALVVEAAVI